MRSCPYCFNQLADSAFVCNRCGARRGQFELAGHIYGKVSLILLGLAVPVAVTAGTLVATGVNAMTVGLVLFAVWIGSKSIASMRAHSRWFR